VSLRILSFVDSCSCNNGGCPANSICVHEKVTFAVKCECKAGYVNIGTSGKVICAGMSLLVMIVVIVS
jgi:hypothetical protein